MIDKEAFNFDGDYGREYDAVTVAIPGYDHLFLLTQAIFQTQLSGPAHILIVGCGTGREIATFAPAHPEWRFTAVDPSQAMVDATQALAERLGIQDRVTVVHGVASDLPNDLDADAATIINVMHFLTDDGAKEVLVRGVAERVKPNAPVALFDLHGDPDAPIFPVLMEAWQHFMEMRGMTGVWKRRMLDRLERGIVYVPEDRILAICARAGLVLQTRYVAGLLYGGWLFTRQA